MNNRVKKMTLAGLLTAIAIIIPTQFGFLRVVIPPFFTATLLSHLPMFLAMLISPMVALVVGIGSAVGFIFAGIGPVIALRALMHAPVGFIGAKVFKKTNSFVKAMLITSPIHGILEGLVVVPFIGFDFQKVVITVALGTFIHHFIDGALSLGVITAMAKATRKKIDTVFN